MKKNISPDCNRSSGGLGGRIKNRRDSRGTKKEKKGRGETSTDEKGDWGWGYPKSTIEQI